MTDSTSKTVSFKFDMAFKKSDEKLKAKTPMGKSIAEFPTIEPENKQIQADVLTEGRNSLQGILNESSSAAPNSSERSFDNDPSK